VIVHRTIAAAAWLLNEEVVLQEWTTCHRPPTTARPRSSHGRAARRRGSRRGLTRGSPDDPDPEPAPAEVAS
jgi:hypothetical protein